MKLQLKENQTIEFKELFNKEMWEKALKTITAFANNGEIGRIFIGVKDDGEIVGIPVIQIEKIKEQIRTSINDTINPSPKINILEIDENDPRIIGNGDEIILEIVIHKTKKQQLYLCNGTFFIRRDSSTFPVKNPQNLPNWNQQQDLNYSFEEQLYQLLPNEKLTFHFFSKSIWKNLSKQNNI